MTPTLKISQSVLTRLQNISHKCSGKLYGIVFEDNLLVVALSIDIENAPDITNSFPTEMDLCGVFDIGTEIINETELIRRLADIDVTDNPIYLSCKLGKGSKVIASFVKNNVLEEAPYTQLPKEEVHSQFVNVRLKAEIPFMCELTADSVKDTVANLRKLFTSGVMAFTLSQTNVYLLASDNENGIIGLTGDHTIGELSNGSFESNEGVGRKRKLDVLDEMPVIEVNMFKKMTLEGPSAFTKPHGPIFILDKRSRQTLVFAAKIDSLSMVHRHTSIAKLYEILVESSVRYIRLLEAALLKKLDSEDIQLNASLPEVFHFFPKPCDHFVTTIYCKNDTEKALRCERELLHKRFNLQMTHPIFRRSNQHIFKQNVNANEPLVNPHVGVNLTNNNGEIALVKGKYRYYHYRQNNMDDEGWGCAYRSLQTLASWFVMQGYAAREVPTFKEIQQCLIDIGDKPASFFNSKQWIGSTEVSFVLETLLNVTSKILYVSSGEEMGSKGPELVYHFQKHGTPVMIGGGVLAHTILGVDYNKETGIIKFLILDPHYTGSEDLKTIRSKGWCGWKGVEFWDKKSYYNMCLPQVYGDI